jgi:hypothetical protein
LTDATFSQAQAAPKAVVDFWSPSCPYCVAYKPIFEDAALSVETADAGAVAIGRGLGDVSQLRVRDGTRHVPGAERVGEVGRRRRLLEHILPVAEAHVRPGRVHDHPDRR